MPEQTKKSYLGENFLTLFIICNLNSFKRGNSLCLSILETKRMLN